MSIRWDSRFTNEELMDLHQIRRRRFPYTRTLYNYRFPCWRCGCYEWGDITAEQPRPGEPPRLAGQECWECCLCGARWNGDVGKAAVDEQKISLLTGQPYQWIDPALCPVHHPAAVLAAGRCPTCQDAKPLPERCGECLADRGLDAWNQMEGTGVRCPICWPF